MQQTRTCRSGDDAQRAARQHLAERVVGRRRTWERDDRFLRQLDGGRGGLQAAGDHLRGGAQVRRQVAGLGDDADHGCGGWDFVEFVIYFFADSLLFH